MKISDLKTKKEELLASVEAVRNLMTTEDRVLSPEELEKVAEFKSRC